MKASNFIFEIGCEELPAKYLTHIRQQLTQMLETELNSAQLEYRNMTTLITPRRIVALLEGLANGQPEQQIERRGPSVAAAYDTQGHPTNALLGFANSCGVAVADLEKRPSEKGDWIFYSGKKQGEATEKILPSILQTILDKLPLPKRMRWGDSEVSFLRPIRWICYVHGPQTIEQTIYHLKVSNETVGHRFHHPGKIQIDADNYLVKLRQAYVMVDEAERRQVILDKAHELAATVNGQPSIDADLLQEVVGLVEWPVPLLASFDKKYLAVPQEALISAMQDHQKCFPVMTHDNQLLPYFIAVSNIESRDTQRVIQGNQKVMAARLADAEFFYRMDCKQTLEARYPNLKQVIFQAKLGTLHDKAERMAVLSRELAIKNQIAVDLAERAARFAKIDLLTDMVNEFPELQGIMGYHYALNDNESSQLATALKEHYMPRNVSDQCPETKLGVVIALADKIDSLVGIFGINLRPTGDKDPFALRRAANGIIRICIEHQLDLDLNELLTYAVAAYQIKLPNKNIIEDCINFIFDRLKSSSHEIGFDSLMFAAVCANKPTVIYDFYRRLQAVKQFKQSASSDALIAANKRVKNILNKIDCASLIDIDHQQLIEASEKTLVTILQTVKNQLEPLILKQNYPQIFEVLAALHQPIDQFFDEVMVMVDDERLKKNRLAILNQIRGLFIIVADIALLAGSKD